MRQPCVFTLSPLFPLYTDYVYVYWLRVATTWLEGRINIFAKAISVRTSANGKQTAKAPAIFIHFSVFVASKNTNEKPASSPQTEASPTSLQPYPLHNRPIALLGAAKSVESHKVASICTAAERHSRS